MCAIVDVANGFGLLPSSQLNVVIGDEIVVQCKANKFVFSPPILYRVDGLAETQLTDRQGLAVMQDT